MSNTLLWFSAILFSACRAVTPTPLASPTIPAPPIIWIPEMQAFDEDFSGKASPTSLEIKAFQSQWRQMCDSIAAQVSVGSLVSISHWAQEQTKSTVLLNDWIASVPMNPMGATKEGKRILFSQPVEQGVPLPVHVPIVFRRLMVGAVYDRDVQAIAKIYITIRGWSEE